MANEFNENGEEKTEDATPRRRQKAREKGSVARSKEINTAVLMFSFVIMAAIYGPFLVKSLIGFVRYWFIHFAELDVNRDNLTSVLSNLIIFYFKITAPFLLIMMVMGVIANVAQFGWLWTKQTVFQGLKLNQLFNPRKAFSKIFGVQGFVTLGINLLKLSLLSIVIYMTLKNELWNLPQLMELPLYDSLMYMVKLLFFLSLRVCAMLIIIAVLDFLWERHKHEKSLKMTKQEIKDERKQVEGDPKVRAKIRGIMQKTAIDRMMKNVPKADVVITNPVHVAVAIQYDRATMHAPQVIAKGARLLAERIKELARVAEVPVIENRIVAQTLYKTVDVGEEVPPKLYQVIAEILAYVYQLNDTKRARARAAV